MKKIENAKRKNGYRIFHRTIVEAIMWDEKKKSLADVLDDLDTRIKKLEDNSELNK